MNTKKKQLKILVVGPDSPHVNAFVKRLLLLGHLVEIVSSGAKHIQHTPNHIVNFSLVRLKNYLETPRSIKKVARAFNPDVVWTHQANSYSFYAIKALKGKYPIALTVWGSDILVAPNSSAAVKKMTQYILKNVDCIAADASYLAEETRKLISIKTTPIYLCQFGMEPIETNENKEAIFYSNRGHYPLYRIDEIIRAFHRFACNQNTSNWKLVIAGESTNTPELKILVTQLGLDDQVDFVGFLSAEENAKWYAKSTYFVSIPESDGTAVSLLEAMYYQCIPIVSDLPANREWITHLENGYIVSDLTSNFFGDVLLNSWDGASAINRQLILEKGTIEASCNQIQHVLNQLLNS